MSLRNRLKDRSTLMRIGLVCLLLGNLVHLFARPTPIFGQGLIDATFGFLIGVSIATLLASLRKTDR
jgi:hypothetical protein